MARQESPVAGSKSSSFLQTRQSYRCVYIWEFVRIVQCKFIICPCTSDFCGSNSSILLYIVCSTFVPQEFNFGTIIGRMLHLYTEIKFFTEVPRFHPFLFLFLHNVLSNSINNWTNYLVRIKNLLRNFLYVYVLHLWLTIAISKCESALSLRRAPSFRLGISGVS